MPDNRHAVLFDFDGTLADSVSAVHTVTNAILARFDFAAATIEEIVLAMPYETPARLAHHAGVADVDTAEAMAADFRSLLVETVTAHPEIVSPVDGLATLLDELDRRGIAAGIVTNNDIVLVERILSAWGVRDRFGAVLGEGSGFDLKPATGAVEECLRRLDVPSHRAAFVGDGRADADAAAAAGLYSIGVEWFDVVRKAIGQQLPLFPRRVHSVAELLAQLDGWVAAGSPNAGAAVSDPVRMLFVRHCESEANLSRVLGSRGPYPLSAAGYEQAATVGAWIAARYRVEGVVSSPLRRAVQTAESIAAATGHSTSSIRIAPQLVEQELGRFSGLSFEQAHARGDYEERKEWRWHWQPEGGESYAEIYERVLPFLHGVRRLADDIRSGAQPAQDERPATIVCVTHAVTMRCLHAALTNSAPVYPTWLPANGQVWDVTFDRVGRPHQIAIYDQEYVDGEPTA